MPGSIRIQRRIHFSRSLRLPTDTLWFELPESCRDWIDEGDAPWVVACLPLACRLGDPVEPQTSLDPVLCRNLQALQDVWSRWFPHVQPVHIRATGKPPRSSLHPGRTGCFFTGGVDSTFTALRAGLQAPTRPGSTPAPPEVLLNVGGIDIPLSDSQALDRRRRTLLSLAAGLQRECVHLRTNLRETILRRLPWDLVMHGPALAAVALLLGRAFHTVYIASSFPRGANEPWGSHAQTDCLMSSSHTQLIHHSDGLSRFQKLAWIVQHKPLPALQHLHVCWEGQNDINCGRCEKCVRTLLALEILGARAGATSFPPTPLTVDSVRQVRLSTQAQVRLMQELLPHARQHGRPDLAAAIEVCLARKTVPRSARATSRWVACRDAVRERLGLHRPIPVTIRPS